MKKVINFIKNNWCITLILILGSILRFYQILEVPPSLNWDEVSHGYNAYSILKTGMDEWGMRFPLIFRAYGDYKLPVYIYLTVISEFIFGLNLFSVRLISILAGIGTIWGTYLLTKEIFKDRAMACISSLLVSIEPWSFFLSRAAFEANLVLFFIVWGVYFFIKGLKNSKLLSVSFLFFGVSLWTYNSARVFVPLFLLISLFIYRKKIINYFKTARTSMVLAFLVLTIFLLPMIVQFFSQEGIARYSKVSIIDQGAVNTINQRIISSKLPWTLNRLVNNKGTYFIEKFTLNYFKSFSPEFIFFKGGSHYQFNVPDTPLIYPINALFLLIGLYLLFRKKKEIARILLIWLFLSPIAASLTTSAEVPHTLRQVVMLPIPMILTSLGLVNSWKWLHEKKLKLESEHFFAFLYIFALSFSFTAFLKNYFTEYPIKYSWSWQYGCKEMVEYVKDNYSDYDKIIINKKYGEAHEFVLFYWPWEPEGYQSDGNLIRFYQSEWWWVDAFDKIYFVNDWDIPIEGNTFVLESGLEVDCEGEKCLLVTVSESYPRKWKKLETIHFLDGSPAFDFYEN